MERRAIGRLRDTDSAAAVEGRLNAAFPDQGGRRFSLIPIQTAAIAEASRPAMKTFARLLSIAVGLLLVIGCLTAGVLLLLRTEARRDDFAMCLALGATRGLLVRGIAIEGAALVGAGSLLSLPLAAGFIAALRNTSLPGGISTAAMNLSGYLIGAAAAGAAAAALVIAFVAVAAGFSTTVQDVLRSRGGSTPRLKGRFARAALIVGQVAVSVVLVAGAGLLARSLAASLKVNPGFETEHLVTSIVGLERYRLTPQAATPYFEQLRDRLAANPAFQSVSVALSAGGMSTAGSLTIDGIERRFPSMVALSVVDERYFSTIGLPILTGRDFSSLDDERTPLVTVVSESLSRMIANGGNPIGSRIKHFHGRQDGSWPALSIVGVVPDVITNVGQLQPLAMYTPVAQSIEPPGWWRRVFVRPRGDVKAAERELATVARQLDPSIRPAPTVTMQTMAEQIGKQMAPQRIAALILGALGGIALLLTALGTYVLAESMAVVQRREMGIRAALGASRSQLTGIVLTEAGRFVGIGLALGLLLAWAQAASVRALLFRVEPLDPVTLVTTAVLISLIAAAVSLRPAIAAGRVDLVSVLRDN
jgi:predicted permease